MIEKQLAELTRNFTEPKVGLRCWTENEKNVALGILRNYYDTVEVSDGRQAETDKKSWIIICNDLKKNHGKVEEALNEAEDFEDDLDLSELNLDSIDDTDDIENADQLTVLKKRASDLAEKWKETFKEISDLAKKLDLVAKHDADLNIEIEKSNGNDANIDDDLEFINNAEKSFDDLKTEQEEDIDDSFGPSEFDDRATKLGPDEPFEESYNIPQDVKIVEQQYPWNNQQGTLNLNENSSIISDPNELPIREDEIDDEF